MKIKLVMNYAVLVLLSLTLARYILPRTMIAPNAYDRYQISPLCLAGFKFLKFELSLKINSDLNTISRIGCCH